MEDILRYNLAETNKWIFSIPFKKIDDSLQTGDVFFNIAEMVTPDLILSETTISYAGYQVPVSTRTRQESKQITIGYLMSSDYHQFNYLYKWYNYVVDVNGQGSTDFNKPSTYQMDCDLIMLSEFKTPVLKIKYFGCQLKSIGGLRFDYKNPSIVTGSFTLSYNRFEPEFVKEL
jgi:hypothetical protein